MKRSSLFLKVLFAFLISSGTAYADEIGTGPGGNDKTGRYEYGTDFGFLDVTQMGSMCFLENPRVKVVDLAHSLDFSKTTAFSYTCDRNTNRETNGAGSPMNDALFFGGVAFDMYNEYLGVDLLDNQLVLKVHFGIGTIAANWVSGFAIIGDGDDFLHPLVSIDTITHEASHGFTEQNSGLQAGMFHSGAMRAHIRTRR